MKIIRILFIKPWHLVSFLAYYLKELVVANLVLSYDILTPIHYMKPGIVEIPLELDKNFELLSMVNLTSMTPGSLSLDVSDDKKKLYVHGMYIDNPEEFKRKIKEGLENRVKKLYS
jgi:multicomponent Na+:H+ antiporter subunit E